VCCAMQMPSLPAMLARRGAVALLVVLTVMACAHVPLTGGAPPLTIDQLKFRVMDRAGTPNYCDPDLYPIARDGGEQANAITTYPQIQANTDLYAAILVHERLPSGDLTDAQKVTVYRAYKLLRAMSLTLSSDHYTFNYRATVGDSIQMVTGTATPDGVVTVTSRTPSGPPPCPICLAAATLIATPNGPVRVTDVKPGMIVWTASPDGSRVAAPVLEVGSTPVPAGHLMVHMKLADGRELLASPGHRTADGRPVGALAVGDPLGGSTVTMWELVPYAGDRTYDLLPAGPTATYWADGIPLASTLTRR
jgi:hypothetical protein